ncbi:MAG: c-type cytochrome [Acidobacteria bacterium]|nr:c-type cytochrome [Acidobacteriota bacterium]
MKAVNVRARLTARRVAAATLGLLVILVGTVWAAGGTALSQQAVEKAETMFRTTCATCHGSDGEGDGPASFGLRTQPQDYSDTAWQASVTDKEIMEAILFGGKAVGLGADMRPNPVLKKQPEVLAALAQMVRSFGGLKPDHGELVATAAQVVKEAKPAKNMSKSRRSGK